MIDNTANAVLLLIVLVIYFLPTIIAYSRDHPRRRPIIFINIMFGWTLLGWAIAFVWALSYHPVEVAAGTSSRFG